MLFSFFLSLFFCFPLENIELLLSIESKGIVLSPLAVWVPKNGCQSDDYSSGTQRQSGEAWKQKRLFPCSTLCDVTAVLGLAFQRQVSGSD